MAICDLCNAPAGANSKRYSCAQFRGAVRGGLRPPDSLFAMGAAFGMSSQDMAAGWVQQVMSDATDWMLCEDCSRQAARHGA